MINVQPGSSKRTPADFLKQILGKVVVVKLHLGNEFSGVLACLDGVMNVILEQAEEKENGQVVATYATVFLRGNNVYYISSKYGKDPSILAK